VPHPNSRMDASGGTAECTRPRSHPE
jgi:hypothetical protein